MLSYSNLSAGLSLAGCTLCRRWQIRERHCFQFFRQVGNGTTDFLHFPSPLFLVYPRGGKVRKTRVWKTEGNKEKSKGGREKQTESEECVGWPAEAERLRRRWRKFITRDKLHHKKCVWVVMSHKACLFHVCASWVISAVILTDCSSFFSPFTCEQTCISTVFAFCLLLWAGVSYLFVQGADVPDFFVGTKSSLSQKTDFLLRLLFTIFLWFDFYKNNFMGFNRLVTVLLLQVTTQIC